MSAPRLAPDQGTLGERLDDLDGSAGWPWDDVEDDDEHEPGTERDECPAVLS